MYLCKKINISNDNQDSETELKLRIDHFTVACLPLNESGAGGDLVLIETSPFFSWQMIADQNLRVMYFYFC